MTGPEQPREQLPFPNSRKACEELLRLSGKVTSAGFSREYMDEWNQDFLQKFGDDQIREARDDLEDQIGRIRPWNEDLIFNDRIETWKDFHLDSDLDVRLGDKLENIPEKDRADVEITLYRMRIVAELLTLIRYYGEKPPAYAGGISGFAV